MRAPLALVVLLALIAAAPAAAEDPPEGEAKPRPAAKPVVRRPAAKPAPPKPSPQPAPHDSTAATSGEPEAAAHAPTPKPRGRPAPPPAPAPPVATFDVVTQENLLWSALADGDQAAVGGLLADDAVFVGRAGVRRKPDFLASLAQCKIHGVKVTDPVRRPLTADVTALAYRVRYQANCQGQQLNGDQTETSVWMRQGPSWRLVLHTEIDSPPSAHTAAEP